MKWGTIRHTILLLKRLDSSGVLANVTAIVFLFFKISTKEKSQKN
jgi:hypothetical protein